MKNVINQVKLSISEQVVESKSIQVKIQSLRWLEGSESKVQALRNEKDAQGRSLHGKKTLKVFARPETGPERHLLRLSKKGLDTRSHLLAYALLRGRSYKSVEAKCSSSPLYTLSTLLLKVLPLVFLGGNKRDHQGFRYLHDKVESWLNGGLVEFPMVQVEAAE